MSEDREGTGIRRARPVDRGAAERAIASFLDALGFDRTDPHLVDTPARVAEAWADTLLGGYARAPVTLLEERFPAPSSGPIVVRDVPVLAVCPHHLLPLVGVAHLGYVPARDIVGFGRLPKLVDACARRLVLQEALAESLVDALVEGLAPKAAVAIVEARHLCVAVSEPAHADTRFRTLAHRGDPAEVERLVRVLTASGPGGAEAR
jgi:GTP cyclohydrolase I